MRERLAPIGAQVEAELKMRLRSFATLAALLAFLVAAFLWLPDPGGNSSSLSWHAPDGRVVAPVYTSGYVGLAITLLGAVILTLFGFYLVAGSVRRDRERGVGAILAATPLSRTSYLCGKFAAHAVYLFVMAALALPAGLVRFARWGEGPFVPGDFLGIYVLTLAPALLFVAAAAVLFDVVPGLSGRGGLVAWFFVFMFVLIALPTISAGAKDPGILARRPAFDPAGAATLEVAIRESVPGGKDFSSGLNIRDKPFPRVPWNGIPIRADLVAARAAQLLYVVPLLVLAILLFDRFDPARSRRRAPRQRRLARLAARFARRETEEPAAAPGDVPRPALSPVSPRPSAMNAVLAETRLIWQTASFLKWPLAAAALLAGVLPGEGARFASAAFLLLAIPIVSEVASREEQNGTRGLVFSQPGVPLSPVLWKAASCALFLGGLGLLAAVRAFVASPARGLAFLAGMLFAAGAAAGLGSLTSGGKLFAAVFLVLWYTALSGLAGADFTGALSKSPVPLFSLGYLVLGAALVAVASLRERLRVA
jgi:ABC-type transport system involved in multi-copper enzyme maturation permease subunit